MSIAEKNINANIDDIHVIEKIPLELPERAIYSRLGRNHRRSRLNHAQQALFDAHIRVGFALCRFQGRWHRLAITEHKEKLVRLQNGVELISEKLSVMLEKSNAVVLLAATAGATIVDEAASSARVGNGVRALIYDAVGSECVDAAVDWLQHYLEQQFKHHGEHLTRRRFSPGYGDWGVENQQIFYNLLALNQMGVELTPTFMLTPEKTVTAIIGIETTSTNRS